MVTTGTVLAPSELEDRVRDVVESRQKLDVLDWLVAGAEAAGYILPPEHAQPRADDVVRSTEV
jgi:hypothetical protein